MMTLIYVAAGIGILIALFGIAVAVAEIRFASKFVNRK